MASNDDGAIAAGAATPVTFELGHLAEQRTSCPPASYERRADAPHRRSVQSISAAVKPRSHRRSVSPLAAFARREPRAAELALSSSPAILCLESPCLETTRQRRLRRELLIFLSDGAAPDPNRNSALTTLSYDLLAAD